MPWLDDMQAVSSAIATPPVSRQQVASLIPPAAVGATAPSTPVVDPMAQVHELMRQLRVRIKKGEMTQEQAREIVAKRMGPLDEKGHVDPRYLMQHSEGGRIIPEIPRDPYDLYGTFKGQNWGTR